ncbi:hypothetical protein QNO08_16725 [Arthrobacter sp. zg-Y820]|nr:MULTISPECIES: hypothetical protein [unclassified Arthrobacter]MCC9197283.1 hypothetical protein [Arthrobacter sp. zg-Y820]MDK1280148.1 hypothetical protein [Arthrobacter sp. zg.Y820]WIB09440.1 hypothetical protein QNO08_16725 [Arthrobacter sp. zg-Y820]
MKTMLTPDDPYPEDLQDLELSDVEILNSKVHRERDVEILRDGEIHPETEFRHEELVQELDRRDEG